VYLLDGLGGANVALACGTKQSLKNHCDKQSDSGAPSTPNGDDLNYQDWCQCHLLAVVVCFAVDYSDDALQACKDAQHIEASAVAAAAAVVVEAYSSAACCSSPDTRKPQGAATAGAWRVSAVQRCVSLQHRQQQFDDAGSHQCAIG